MSAPFKMKGHALPGPNQRLSPAKHKITNPETGSTSIYHDHAKPKKKSPAKNVTDPRHPHNKKGEHTLTETRTATSVTKSKGGKSSTYNITNTKDNKNGSKTHTFTNELGNSYQATHSNVDKKKKSSPTKLAPLIAAVAPMVIKAVAGKAMEKKEK
tara:strand:- start:46 stop:513 length:468 start_codon:yes stop_codon:yes gene_type:complete